MVLGDFILLLTGIYTLYKNDISKKNDNAKRYKCRCMVW